VLPGDLGAVVTIDPKTRKQNGQAFDDAMAHLRYGAIGINAWTGMAFALATWGAFPGNTAQDIGSGTGTVHKHLYAPEASESRCRDPVPSRAALVVQRRTDPSRPSQFSSSPTRQRKLPPDAS